MYTPAHFQIDDLDQCFDVVERRGFGTLVVAVAGGMEASPIPWVLDRGALGSARLLGHVSKANPLSRLLVGDSAGLVLIDLVDGYVSPSWYPSKADHARVVPTWNYISVHLHGTVRTVHDEGWLRTQIARLTNRHEAGMTQPWTVADAPVDFIDSMVRGIVGVEFAIERVEGKAKLSQNRPAEDVAGVLAGLAQRPDSGALATEMVQRSVRKEAP
jgi:transcriptional regulator